MNTHVDKIQKNKSKQVGDAVSQLQYSNMSTFRFVDNRREAVMQKKLQESANYSPRSTEFDSFPNRVTMSPQVHQGAQSRTKSTGSQIDSGFQQNDLSVAQMKPDIVQLEDIGLGFSELTNETYDQEDVFGSRHDAKNNLSGFRDSVNAKGPSAFVKGVASQRVDGGIQKIFTQGIKQAMAQSLTIKQNLSGFTVDQIHHARDHPPILTDEEAEAARKGSIFKDYGPESAELWSGMTDAPSPYTWTADIATISVWELSHMLHNRELFNKTKFFNYNTSEDDPNAEPISEGNLSKYGIELNEDDLKSLDELGIKASKSDTGGNWFTKLFCCCF